MNARNLWARILIITGSTAMLVGAIDPMEGSLVILPGSALVALGTFLGESERRLIVYRVWVFVLIAIGVGALWGFSMVGGFGGHSGRSMWWGMLVLPYLIGWSMGIWGPATPRWVPVLGVVVGLWYLVIPVMVLMQSESDPRRPVVPEALIVIALVGVLTMGGCIGRLRKRVAGRPSPAVAVVSS